MEQEDTSTLGLVPQISPSSLPISAQLSLSSYFLSYQSVPNTGCGWSPGSHSQVDQTSFPGRLDDGRHPGTPVDVCI